MSERGRLITFEGGEGAGKSTQIERLAVALRDASLEVVVTREPGGTQGAEQIRKLLLEGAVDRWLPLSELFLLLAARHDHVRRRIAPALAAGHWVLCDRFSDSTRVYQGLAGTVEIALIDRLHEIALADLHPDLTVILDLPAAQGLGRRRRAAGHHRYERMSLDFHERVRAGFLALAQAEPQRCAVIAADRAIDAVAGDIRALVARCFGIGLEAPG
jgi:dTMP kinase